MIAKLTSSKFLFFLLTTIVILGLNLTPLIMQYQHSPPGRTFTLIHNNTQDYYFYQSLMNQGANGAFLTSDPYTSEPHQPSIIFSYFLILGKLSKVLGLSYALMYHLSRIVLGFFLLLTTYYLLLFLKVPYPRLTYLFFLYAAPFMHTINDYGTLRQVPFMNWWNGVDPIRRAAFLPHHMMGGLLLVVSVILLIRYLNAKFQLKSQNFRTLFLLIILAALMAFIHTPSLLIMLLILPLALIFFSIINSLSLKSPNHQTRNQNKYQNNQNQKISYWSFKNLGFIRISDFGFRASQLIGLLVYWVIGLLFLVLMVSQTKNGFPWSQYIDWEKNLQFPLERELIGALGILFPFSLLGIYSAVKSKKFEYIFVVCWLVVPFLFIPFAKILNLSNIRLIQGIPYLPLSILAVLGIKVIENWVKQLIIPAGGTSEGIPSRASPKGERATMRLGLLPNFIRERFEAQSWETRVTGPANKKFCIEVATVGIFIIAFIIFSLPTIEWSFKDQIREYWPIYGNVYLDNRLFEAFKYINNNFPPKTVTISTFYAGNYLPVYTNTVSFIGHFGYTYNEKEKEEKTKLFFEGKMSAEEAKSFLSNNKITLVFQGPEEKPLYKNYLYPTILKTVYDKEEVNLYLLKP